MFQEVGSALQIDIKELFQISLHEIPEFPFIERQFSKKNKKYFESGRNAVEYIFRFCIPSKRKTVLLPEFLCSSISDAVLRAGWTYEYYSVGKDLEIIEEDIKKKVRKIPILFIIDYFGKNQSQTFLKKLKQENPEVIVIEDCTQSLLSNRNEECAADYILASLRKWFAIPSGGGVWSNRNLPDIAIASGVSEYTFYYFIAQIMKTEYLRDQSLDKNRYLEWMNKGIKKLFEDYSFREIDELSARLLSNADWEEIRKRRIDNYNILKTITQNSSQIQIITKLQDGEVPFCVPIKTEDRDELMHYLIQNNIYCNIHWRIFEQKSYISSEILNLSRQILSIPCDQRYGADDMRYIGSILNKWEGRK